MAAPSLPLRGVVLASQSPRRIELLGQIVDPSLVEVRPADLDEDAVAEGLAPIDGLLRVSRAKAEASWKLGDLLLAADTIVIHDGVVIGKPADRDDAFARIAAMRGSIVEVATNVVVKNVRGARRDRLIRTKLHMGRPSDDEIRAYVATGAADDKAGGLAVQGGARSFVEHIDGCYTNVLGLPLCAAADLLNVPGVCLVEDGSPCPEPTPDR